MGLGQELQGSAGRARDQPEGMQGAWGGGRDVHEHSPPDVIQGFGHSIEGEAEPGGRESLPHLPLLKGENCCCSGCKTYF